jgi:hypothetical protein
MSSWLLLLILVLEDVTTTTLKSSIRIPPEQGHGKIVYTAPSANYGMMRGTPS